MTGDVRGYVVCTEPRSGSNLLASVLGTTGRLGQAWEYFNGTVIRGNGHPDYPYDPESQLSAFLPLSSTPNGVYALKVFSSDFDRVKATRWPERLPNLAFVYLERRDMLGQAISMVRAAQTRAWTSLETRRADPVFDRDHITSTLVDIARAQTRWTYWFARNGLPVLKLTYEDVVAYPQLVAELVARQIGLAEPVQVDMTKVDLQVQRDEINEAWRARFLAEARDLSVFH